MRRKLKRKIRYNVRAGGEKRGNNKDRAARKRWMLKFFGTGATAPCAHCEKKLTYETITADRIVPGNEGGTYRRENIVPSCLRCNQKRFAGERQGSKEEAAMRAAFGLNPNWRKKKYKIVKRMKFSKKFKSAYRRRKAA